MANNTRSLDDISIAYLGSDDSWVWKDDMITFPADDGFYDDDEESDCWFDLSFAEDGLTDGDMGDYQIENHPICGEFPHDSIIAPRGWDKVD